MPLNCAELTSTSSSLCSTYAVPSATSPAAGATTCTTGSSKRCANAKSRSSCAGTAMIAPVPYPIST